MHNIDWHLVVKLCSCWLICKRVCPYAVLKRISFRLNFSFSNFIFFGDGSQILSAEFSFSFGTSLFLFPVSNNIWSSFSVSFIPIIVELSIMSKSIGVEVVGVEILGVEILYKSNVLLCVWH